MYRTDAGGGGGLTSDFAALEPLSARQSQPSRLARACKRLVDIVGALVFILLFLPLFIGVAVGVVLSSRGAIVFSQPRVGRGGRTFTFYKFRSMRPDSDEVLTSFLDSDPEAKQRWAKYQKIDNDPRITKFGHFIRRTSLDELPQLWNVLTGDMSLVGPRPCLIDQKERYGPCWSLYCATKPGVTGLWQVSGRNRLTFRERVALDARYVTNWSLWLDFVILVRTAGVVLTGHGSK